MVACDTRPLLLSPRASSHCTSSTSLMRRLSEHRAKWRRFTARVFFRQWKHLRLTNCRFCDSRNSVSNQLLLGWHSLFCRGHFRYPGAGAAGETRFTTPSRCLGRQARADACSRTDLRSQSLRGEKKQARIYIIRLHAVEAAFE